MTTKPLSIAIFGNTNNYPLLLAIGLKELGHSVRLVVNRKELLHRPESCYPNFLESYPNWIFDCSNITDEDIAGETRALLPAIECLTKGVDLVLLNDSGVALAGYLKAPHVALLTGSDLTYYANFESLQIRTSMWDLEFKRSDEGQKYVQNFTNFIARQRDGILSAKLVTHAQRGLILDGDKLLNEIGVADHRRLMIFFSNTIDLKTKPFAHNNCFTILNGSRIVYQKAKNTTRSDTDFKGTDILLKGFAIYCKNGGNGELRLVRKGQDLEDAISLIADLGITNRVRWLDEMSLSNFYKEMASSDLVCDQFGTSFPGMVTADAYALGRPVISNFKNECLSQRFSKPFPGFDAKTSEEVANYLTILEKNPNLLMKMGKESREYAEMFLSPKNMAAQLLKKLSNL